MSFTVIYQTLNEEFDIRVSLDEVQAYFGVFGGGLKRNGTGPIVSPEDGGIYDLVGSRPFPLRMQQINRKNAQGKRVVSQVLAREIHDDTNDEDEKGSEGVRSNVGLEKTRNKRIESASSSDGPRKRIDSEEHLISPNSKSKKKEKSSLKTSRVEYNGGDDRDEEEEEGEEEEEEEEEDDEKEIRTFRVRFDIDKPPERVEWKTFYVCFAAILLLVAILMAYLWNYDPDAQLRLRANMNPMIVEALTVVLISIFFGFLAFFH